MVQLLYSLYWSRWQQYDVHCVRTHRRLCRFVTLIGVFICALHCRHDNLICQEQFYLKSYCRGVKQVRLSSCLSSPPWSSHRHHHHHQDRRRMNYFGCLLVVAAFYIRWAKLTMVYRYSMRYLHHHMSQYYAVVTVPIVVIDSPVIVIGVIQTQVFSILHQLSVLIRQQHIHYTYIYTTWYYE